MPPTDRYVAENTFYVRYAETDAQAIVHHSSYIVYFEEGRSHYARARGEDYADFEKQGVLLVVSEVQARYHRPAVYGQQITVRCWIEEMKSRQVAFGYEIVEAAANMILVTGITKHICVTRQGRVTAIPDAWRAWAGT